MSVNVYACVTYEGNSLTEGVLGRIEALYDIAQPEETKLCTSVVVTSKASVPFVEFGRASEAAVRTWTTEYVDHIISKYTEMVDNDADTDASKRIVYAACPMTVTTALASRMGHDLPYVAWKVGANVQLLNLSAEDGGQKFLTLVSCDVNTIPSAAPSDVETCKEICCDYLFVAANPAHDVTDEAIISNTQKVANETGKNVKVCNVLKVKPAPGAGFVTADNIGSCVSSIKEAMEFVASGVSAEASRRGSSERAVIVHCTGPQPFAYTLGACYGQNLHGSLFSVERIGSTDIVIPVHRS